MSDQILESTHGDLKEITLISSTGKIVDIKAMCQDFILIEDIFMPTLYGELHIKDAQNIPVFGDMHGNEYIHVILETPSIPPIDKYFRIYSITDLRAKTGTSFEYIIHFCSEESVLNQQMLICKSYKTLKNSDIVSDILKNKLKVPDKKIAKIENTVSQEDIIVPNMKPFETINWIASYSLNQTLGSAFVFFESSKGYNFVSLETLFEQKPYKSIKIAPKNVDSSEDKAIENRFIVDKYEILSAFNIQDSIPTGAFSSSMLKIDLLHYKYNTIYFNIANNKYNKLNKESPINNAKNRLDKTLVGETAYMRYFPNFQGDLTDKWVLQRASQFSLLNSFRMRVQMSGDAGMPVGSVIQLDFPLIQPTEDSSGVQRDYYKSGNYLVTRIKHRVFENKYFGYLEISKDSMMSAIPGAKNSADPDYNKATKA